MVEDVERIHAELAAHTLGDAEALRHGQVGKEHTRSTERVAANTANRPALRTRKPVSYRPGIQAEVGTCTPGDGQRRDRSEVTHNARCRISVYPHIERTPANVRTARSGICILAALAVAWGPRQTAAPIRRGGQLPSADQQVRQAVCIGRKSLACAKWQLIDDVGHENLITV